jgi:Cu/Ag efflux pump CusA
MRALTSWSLNQRVLIVAAAVVLVVFGITRGGNTPINLLPEFSPVIVEIQTEALGLSAAEVEQLITVPLEADLLNGVAWVESIRSESIPGLSSVELRFEPGTDPMDARHMVQEKMTQAHALPHVSKPPEMMQPLSSTSRVLQIGMTSKDLSLIQMSVLARWNIRPRLMGVPGVANVSVWGMRNRQLQVLVDPERIRSNGVTLLDVISTAGNALWVSPLSFLDASSPGTGGFIDSPNQRLGIRHVLPIVSPEGLAKVAIEGSDKRLGDVVQIVENHQPMIGDAIVGGETGLMLVVEKLPDANTVTVTQAVEKALDQLRPGLKGVEFDTQIYRPANFITDTLGSHKVVASVAGALFIAGVFLFFFDLRLALIGAASVVTSLLMAWLVLYLRGTTFDALILAGMAVALAAIVDDAILDAHHIRKRLAQRRAEGASVLRVIVDASAQVRGPMTFATLMVLLLVLPMALATGVLGAFVGAVAKSYALAIVASAVVAATLTPALCFLLLPKDGREPSRSSAGSALAAAIGNWSRATRAAYAVTAAAIVLAIGAAIPLSGDIELVPSFRETNVLIDWVTKSGTSMPEMTRITTDVTRELRKIPGVKNVGAHVGRAISSDRVVGVSSGELWISIDPKADYDATMNAINETIWHYPGIERDTSTYANERIEKLRTIEANKVIARVYGQDTDVLAVEAEKIKNLLSDVSGASEIEIPPIPIEPTIEIRVDLAKASAYGIKPGDVRRAATTLLSGLEVGSLFEDKKVFEVVVWGTPETRSNISDVRNLLIQSPNGSYLRVSDVADVRVTPHPVMIKREGVARYMDVEIDVSDRSLKAVADEVRILLANHKLPSEYHVEVMGDYAKRDSMLGRVLTAAAAAAICILLLLQAAFRSWRLAFMVMLGLPVAAAGAVLAALASGAELSLPVLCGLIVVIGLALRLATQWLTHAQHLARSEGMSLNAGLVQRTVQERVEPMLATLIVSALVFLPFAFMRNSVGLDVLGPMAGVVLAGLVTTFVFVFFVLPALYLAHAESPVADADYEDLRVEASHA